MSKKGYLIMYTESLSSPVVFYIPSVDEIPFKVYGSLVEAKDILRKLLGGFNKVVPIQYGIAFPYDKITFDQHLTQKGYAIYGMAEKMDEDEDEPLRVGIAIVSVDYPA
jgi:hypothetical protein